MKYFGGIKTDNTSFEKASAYLQPIRFDGTSTWGKGADKGFDAFLEASENMELYDIETDSEVYKKGIHVLNEIRAAKTTEVYNQTYFTSKELLRTNRFLTFIGGEHSISIGIIKAFYEKYPGLTVLQLDAHADLRPKYDNTPLNHACALHDASINTNLIQVGIRSMDSSEKRYMNRNKCFFMHEIYDNDDWMEKSIELMQNPVYITLDVDVFDPSIMPSTGTPEPGGMKWYQMLTYLKKVFRNRNVVGFDMVELAPVAQFKHPEFLVSKLYYKMLSYKFENNEV